MEMLQTPVRQPANSHHGGEPYACDLATRADDVDQFAWQEVCASQGNPYLDLRFLRTVETSFADEADVCVWYAIFRDDAGTAVACACFSTYLVDGMDTAPRFIRTQLPDCARRGPAC